METSINLNGNLLVYTNKQLLFNDLVIYNFDDRFHNLSTFGVEQQIQVFDKLFKLIYDTGLPNEIKAQAIMTYAHLFKFLSESNSPTAVLSLGEKTFNNSFAQILGFFGNDNKLFETFHTNKFTPSQASNVTSILVDEHYRLDFLADNYFSTILINLEFVKNDIAAIFTECNRLIRKKGRIICYGPEEFITEKFHHLMAVEANIYSLSSERSFICFDFDRNHTANNRNDAKEQILHNIEVENAELYTIIQFLVSNPPSSNPHEWHAAIDNSIQIVSRIESIIAENYAIFDNDDLKFNTNEVKNALLDFKYNDILNRKHYDFFQSVLVDCYKSWTESIS